jgi:DHA2 family metal-tetracycline-proton antiporter-like MFS transporter
MSSPRRAAPVDTPSSTRLFLLVVASAVFTSVLTGSMVNVVIPAIRAEFAASPAQIGWVITGFALAYAVSVPLYGRVSDLFGVRRVFTFGVLGFALGGFICALAPNLPVLILGRVVQAAGGAAVPALATVAVARVIPDGQRGSALGLVASSVGVGAAVGPVVGGIVGELSSWRVLFIGSLALMLLILPLAHRVLPNGNTQGGRFDLLGGVLLGLGAGLFLFGITQGQTAGFTGFASWGSFVGAVLATLGFVWRINTAPEPFVPPALFANRAYVTALVVGFFAMFANLASLVLVPLLVVEESGLAPGAAGLVLTPGAIALALLSPMTGRLSDRVGVKVPLVIGLSLMTLAMLLLSSLAGASPVWIALGVLGVSSGFAFIQSPANNAAAGALPPADVGAGLGLFSGAFFLGGGTGTALMGALLAARQEQGAEAVNPLYSLGAAPFSDAFLALALALLIALGAVLGLKSRPQAQTTTKVGEAASVKR